MQASSATPKYSHQCRLLICAASVAPLTTAAPMSCLKTFYNPSEVRMRLKQVLVHTWQCH